MKGKEGEKGKDKNTGSEKKKTFSLFQNSFISKVFCGFSAGFVSEVNNLLADMLQVRFDIAKLDKTRLSPKEISLNATKNVHASMSRMLYSGILHELANFTNESLAHPEIPEEKICKFRGFKVFGKSAAVSFINFGIAKTIDLYKQCSNFSEFSSKFKFSQKTENSWPNALKTIAPELTTSIFRDSFFNVSSYKYLLRVNRKHRNVSPFEAFFAGSAISAVGESLATPLENIQKALLMETKDAKPILERIGGVKGAFSGIGKAMIRNVPINGLEMVFLSELNKAQQNFIYCDYIAKHHPHHQTSAAFLLQHGPHQVISRKKKPYVPGKRWW